MTLEEYIDLARKAIADGKLDEAEQFTKQAQAIKALEALTPAPVAAPAAPEVKTAAGQPVRLPFAPAADETSVEDVAVKTWYVKKYGAPDAAVTQIAHELYHTNYEQIAYAKARDFNRYLRSGLYDPALKSLIVLTPTQILNAASFGTTVAEIKATMVEGTDTLGGYGVPEDFRTDIIQRLPGLTIVRPLANVITTSRDRVSIPKATGGNSRYTGNQRVYKVDESPLGTEAATNATFGQVAIPIHTIMGHVTVTNNLLEDTAFNLPTYLSAQFAVDYAIFEDEQFLVGNGIGGPVGILKNATTGGPSDTDTQTTKTTSNSTLTADALVALPLKLDAQYRQGGAVWAMAKATRAVVEGLKDSNNRYLLSNNDTNLQDGQHDRLRGYAVKESEAMPAMGTGNYPIIFGDFSGYTIAERVGMTVQRYEDSATAKQNAVVFVSRRRLGGQVSAGWQFIAHLQST